MYGVGKYLLQQFPDAWYSEMLYVRSVIAGAISVASADHNKDGATFILIAGIIVTSTDIGTLVTLTDQFTRLLFVVHANGNSTGYYETPLLIKTESLRINANIANANFVYTVQYQYLRNADVKAK